MKHMTSLEAERQALLEQIHTSRETYRRMLTDPDALSGRPARSMSTNVAGHSQGFPRSMTMRWIVAHPYMSAAAVAAIALLGTRTTQAALQMRQHRTSPGSKYPASPKASATSYGAGTRPRTARTRSTDFPQYGSGKPMTAARSVFTGLLTLSAMLLRDPRKMQAATSAITAAAAFIQSRRSRQAHKHQSHTVRVK